MSNHIIIKHTFSSETRMKSAAYALHIPLVNSSQDSSMDHQFANLLDRNNSTCLKAELNGDMWLQVAFTLAGFPFDNKMAIEVVVNNETDCASDAWTWFVHSTCTETHLSECRNSPLESQGQFRRCSITCQCPTACENVYIQITPVAYLDQSMDEICEVYLLYYVKPEPRGRLP